MCGLIGYSGPEPFDPVKINTLMYISTLERGDDATGIYTTLNGLKKDNIEGWKFVTNGKNELIPDTMFMGHVRAKTIGLNTTSNAHPFHRGKCVLMHNGTLVNHWSLFYKYELERGDYHVDSDILCGCIAKTGDLVPLKEINGAAAVVLHSTDDPDRMYIFRNKERPLYRGDIGANVYICSISEALVVIGCTNIKEFKEDHVYTIEKGEYIGNCKKLKNTPYSFKNVDMGNSVVSPSRSTSSSYNTSNGVGPVDARVNHAKKMGELRRAIGCNVRSKYYFESDTSDKFTLLHDKYYQITSVINLEEVRIWDDVTKLGHIVKLTNLEEWDIIQTGNFVRALCDIRLDGESKSATPIITKGQVLRVQGSYDDGELSFMSLLKPHNQLFFTKKYNFKKLTKKQLVEHVRDIEDEAEGGVFALSSAVNANPEAIPLPAAIVLAGGKPLFSDKGELMLDAEGATSDVVRDEEHPVDDIIASHVIALEDEELSEAVIEHLQTMEREINDVKSLCEDMFVDDLITNKVKGLMSLCIEFYNNIFETNTEENAT